MTLRICSYIFKKKIVKIQLSRLEKKIKIWVWELAFLRSAPVTMVVSLGKCCLCIQLWQGHVWPREPCHCSGFSSYHLAWERTSPPKTLGFHSFTFEHWPRLRYFLSLSRFPYPNSSFVSSLVFHHVSFCVFTCCGYGPGRGIAGSCGKYMFHFVRNCQVVFPSGCTILHTPQPQVRGLLFPHPSPHLL